MLLVQIKFWLHCPQGFWIIAAREAILEWEKECAMCQKRKAKIAQQTMASLPLNRLTMSLRAFTRVAVDFGGPFMTVQRRGKPRQEIFVFVYMLNFKSSVWKWLMVWM